MSSADSYHLNKSYAEVERYLEKVHRRVKLGQFKIAEREDKNLPFIRMYNLASKKRQAKMLEALCTEDCLHVVLSKLEGNDGQELFVFV